ncbi:MAG: hypothetical protein HeimC3_17330 [Candidatus Heimdallarchaeota archaeon LC_3]|nr:MAG: hypothetical protein HeimC3_17330 [Candidatus Heimdallarchaeota archaeon LC_3]
MNSDLNIPYFDDSIKIETNNSSIDIKWKFHPRFKQEIMLYVPSIFWNLSKETLTTVFNELTKKFSETSRSWLVFILKEEVYNSSLINTLNHCGVVHYITELNSELNLQKFSHKEVITKEFSIEQLIQGKWKNEIDNENSRIWHSLWNLEKITSDDIPDREGFKHEALQEFYSRFQSGESSIETIFIAIKNNIIIGLTYCWFDNDIPNIYFTGVLKEYRGLGIGTLLKSNMTDFLKSLKYLTLRTNNKENNSSILLTNYKLGFKIIYKTYLYRLQLKTAIKKKND